MYSINAVPLDNPTYGWVLLGSSTPLSNHGQALSNLRTPGRDGVVRGLPSTADPVPLSLLVETPREHLETLLVLARSASTLGLVADASRTAEVEFVAAPLDGFGDADAIVEVRIVLRIPGAYWRDAVETTTALTNLTAASVDVDVLAGLSAPVQDAIVRVRGACTGLRVTDDGTGAWFDYADDLPAGNYLRFDSATGRAWVTTTDTWTGGTEVSGAIDLDGPRGVFELTPVLAPGNPSSRVATLVVTTATRASAAAQVRARGAYIV